MDATAGAGGSTAGAGGSAGESRDPDPVEVDLTGLVATSGSHLVLTRKMSSGEVARELVVVDIASGEVHDANPQRGVIAYPMPSPDGKTFVFSGANAASDMHLFIARFTADGFVPARLVSGFVGRPANYSGYTWTADGRFVGLARGSNLIDRGVDLVDTWMGARHASIDGANLSSARITIAPAGLWFYYWFQSADEHRFGHARITADGTSAPIELPQGAGVPTFSPGGSRLFYRFRADPDEPARLFHTELPGTPSEVPAQVDGHTAPYLVAVEQDGQHVLVTYTNMADRQVLFRIAVDGSQEPLLLSDPARSLFGGPTSPVDGSVLLLLYADDSSQQLELADPRGGQPPLLLRELPDRQSARVQSGSLSRHVYYVVGDELHLVHVDGDGRFVDTRVSEPGESDFSCLSFVTPRPPAGKLVFGNRGTGEMVLLDLAGGSPSRITTIAPGSGGLLQCPEWSPDGEAFAFVERNGQDNGVYLVRWGEAGPEAPVLVHEQTGIVDIAMTLP
jgi:hypothetical protein